MNRCFGSKACAFMIMKLHDRCDGHITSFSLIDISINLTIKCIYIPQE